MSPRQPCTIEGAHCEDCGSREFTTGRFGPECAECGGDLTNPDECSNEHQEEE